MTRKSWRILIADDNPDDLADMRRMLLLGSEDQFTFISAELGKTAAEAVLAHPEALPDCMLLDYYLPDMDALDVLALLQGADGMTVCPVVVLTGADNSELGRLLLRRGAQDFIGKDWLTPNALARTVENAAERWAMARELKERERLLTARERELHTLAENTPDVLTRFDRSLRFVFVNAAAEKITGHAPAFFQGKSWSETGLAPALCALWEQALQDVLASGKPGTLEFSLEDQLPPRHYVARLVPEFGDAGVVEFVLGVSHDITDHWEAARALQDSAERMQLALTAAQAGTWAWDIRSGSLTWSLENFALNARDPVLGQPTPEEWQDLLHGEDRALVESAIADAVLQVTPEFRSEYRLRLPGGIRWIHALGRVDFDAQGNPLRMFGINLDITDRKQMEQAMREEDWRKDAFLATLAHELRNPLAPLLSGLDVLKHAPAGGATAIAARNIMERQLFHMVRLIDDLLDISRVSTGKVELRCARVTIQDVLTHAVESSQPLVDAAEHDFALQMPYVPIWIDGDLTRLAQVVSNLLNNAIKYTPRRGQIRITATCEQHDAVIRITDNGVGIAADMIPKVFDLFTQVEGTVNRAVGGLGIGLALVRSLLEMHGGSVVGDSPGLGLGCTFTVRLPLAIRRAGDTPPDVVTRRDEATFVLGLHTQAGVPDPDTRIGALRQLLVIDDNIDAADMLCVMLQMSGYGIRSAHDGEAALALLDDFYPDVAFVDIGLPGMNGYEVARHIRTNPRHADIVLVALTGWGSAADKRRAIEAGFDFHLTKPVDLATVVTLLEQMPARAPAQDASATDVDPVLDTRMT